MLTEGKEESLTFSMPSDCDSVGMFFCTYASIVSSGTSSSAC